MQSRTYFSERERSNGLRRSECLGNTAQTRLQTTCTRTVQVRALDLAGSESVSQDLARVHARATCQVAAAWRVSGPAARP